MSRVIRYNGNAAVVLDEMKERIMLYDAILFDLDGTLLPMDNDVFVKGYLHLLARTAAECGYPDERAFLKAMWKGVSDMVINDGSCLNEKVFWKSVAALLGDGIYEHISAFDAFYGNGFHEAKKYTGPNPLAKRALKLAREKGKKVILATNPLFPTVAVHARLSWIGLKPEDFDWITDYSNSCTCKPNPAYYLEIAEKFDLDPERCLMIGNNAQEDAQAAGSAGMNTYLVTDWLICEGDLPKCPQGSFSELIDYLERL